MITSLQLQDANNARSIYNQLQPRSNIEVAWGWWAIYFFLSKTSNNLEEEGLLKCLPCCVASPICYLSIHVRAVWACRWDTSHEHCSAETEESQAQAVFYRWDEGQSWHCLLYTCTLTRECLGCQGADSAPHVDCRDHRGGSSPWSYSQHKVAP